VITVFAVVRVIRSNDSKYSVGDILLSSNASVAEYSIVPSSQITRKIDTSNGISLSDYLGSLGKFFLIIAYEDIWFVDPFLNV
jgi:NADPH-dependent curcumin reductase CurA